MCLQSFQCSNPVPNAFKASSQTGDTNGSRGNARGLPGSPELLDSLDRGLRIAARRLHQHTLLSDAISTSFLISFMSTSHTEAKRPASTQPDAKSTAKPAFKLKDGALTVTVFVRNKDKEDQQIFIVPERTYKNKDNEWASTHILHQDDLLSMSLLLEKAYSRMKIQLDEPKS